MGTAAQTRNGPEDVRAAARNAAQLRGVTLGQWFDEALLSQAELLGVSPSELQPAQRIDAILVKLREAHARSGESDSKLRTGVRVDPHAERGALPEAIRDGQRGSGEPVMHASAQRREHEDHDTQETPVSTQPATGIAPDDVPASPGSALAAADSRQAAQRVEIESKLAALFKALDRTPRRHAAEAGDEYADEGRRRRTLLGETAMSPSWRLDKAVAEIAERQAFLDRQTALDGDNGAARPGFRAGSSSRPDIDDVRRAFAAPASPAEAVPSVFASLQGDIARLASRLEAVQLDVSRLPSVPPRGASLDEIRAMLSETQSDPSLEHLGASVEKLAARLDAFQAGDDQTAAIERLSRRIEAVHSEVTTQLATFAPTLDMSSVERLVADIVSRSPAVHSAAPDLHTLEVAVRDLAGRLSAAGRSGDSDRLLLEMQGQVTRLAERIDRTDAGLTAIVAMERSLGDIFSQVGEMKEVAVSAAAAAGRSAAEEAMLAVLPHALASGAAERDRPAAVDEVTRGLAELKADREHADQRLHAVLAALNASLERVVDRLGALESDAAETGVPAREEDENAPRLFSTPPDAIPAPLAHASGSGTVEAGSSAPVAPSVTWSASPGSSAFEVSEPLDLDLPLEPGTRAPGATPEPTVSAPSASPDPTTFIAAARRAAQNAAREQALRLDVEAPASAPAGEAAGASRFKVGMLSRRRPLLLALAGLLVLAGAAQIARMSLLDSNAPLGTSDDRTSTIPAVTPPVPPPGDRSEAQPAGQATDEDVAAAQPGAAETARAPTPDAPKVPDDDAAGQTAAAASTPDTTSPEATPGHTLPTMAMGPLASVAALKAADTSAQLSAVPGIPLGLQQLADGGQPEAQFEVGLRYAEGRKVARDMKVAVPWFEKAAARGLAPAAYRLGSVYEKGLGVPRDAAQALTWYRKAADAGNVRAMHNLAVMLAEGSATKADYPQAASWFTKAAEAGVRDSQYNLAILYARGLGVGQDLGQSYKWFAVAAAQGDTDSVKKRDEVASRMSAPALEAAKASADTFKPAPIVAASNDVKAPAGGWDGVLPRMPAAATAPPPAGNAHLSRL